MKSEAGFVLAVSGLLSRWLSLAVLRFRSGAPHSDLPVIPLEVFTSHVTGLLPSIKQIVQGTIGI